MTGDSESVEARVVALVQAGRKIEAVRLYRDTTGVGLAEAKEFIEALAARRPTSQSPTPGDDPDRTEQAVIALLLENRKIEAVKVYRQATGVGLKQAKEAVEAIGRSQAIPGASGCLGVLAAWAAFMAAAALMARQ